MFAFLLAFDRFARYGTWKSTQGYENAIQLPRELAAEDEVNIKYNVIILSCVFPIYHADMGNIVFFLWVIKRRIGLRLEFSFIGFI